ncbi:MAG: hypothetical protein Edafosvirus11_15 [Edafosvirus sp.]|uniref:lipoate--protein ligase n=1 Tax=Edafosvirus sp. TaxID=2487765 RepID=A0A3G4ZU01_9VIRU|nr:MAG: hypothetical protein Edafosvirus11_15 [Edafosvirus sp.]
MAKIISTIGRTLSKNVRVLQTTSSNPFFNLSYEELMYRKHPCDATTLYLWRNSPNVVIGRHQNPYKECNLTNMQKDNVELVRRKSGGGTVYQDYGNAIFSIVSPGLMDNKHNNNKILLSALKTIGINAEATGRNDITVDGKKISGSAFRLERDLFLHHGTMLLNLNFQNLKKYVTPNKAKMESKGVSSVEARVSNVSDIVGRDVTYEEWCDALKKSFTDNYGVAIPTEYIKESDYKNNSELNNIMNERTSKDWRYGNNCDFKYKMETRFTWGTIDVNIEAEKGKITQIKIYSDCLNPAMIEDIQSTLLGVEFKHDAISKTLHKLADINKPPVDEHIKEFLEWFVKNL